MKKKKVFVSEMVGNSVVKKVGTFIIYKTWDGTPWMAEVVDKGDAFYHWQPGKREEGHRDTIIRYIGGDGRRWQSTISNYVFMHALEGDIRFAHFDMGIVYLNLDGNVYRGTFADTYED